MLPLKFKPRLMERIWGGDLLGRAKGRGISKTKRIGESWEISAVDGDLSVVSNGTLMGNNIEELVEIYMGDLVGDKVYDRFGLEFPLLVKIIDTHDTLSVQVHPCDKLASERHSAYGKTEMWYVVDCKPNAFIYVGFSEDVTENQYKNAVENCTLPSLINKVNVKKGDAFFIPAGTIHAIGGGVLLAEIQQTSDITYRIYDWDRVDSTGQPRQLHTELAKGALNLHRQGSYDITPQSRVNSAVEIISCEYFTSNIIELDGTLERDHSKNSSFVIYICTEGLLSVETDGGTETMHELETILIPAEETTVTLCGRGIVLEVFIK